MLEPTSFSSGSEQQRRSPFLVPTDVLAKMLGILIFFPAVGIPLGGSWVQPLDFVAIPTFVLMFPRFSTTNSRAAALVGLCLISWTVSVLLAPTTPGWVEFGYYVFGVAPFLMATLMLMQTERGRDRFIQGFLLGGLVSSSAACIQGLLGGSSVIDFRTNETFNLLAQPGRSMAFFPEASGFAAAAIVHAAVLLHLRARDGASLYLGRWLRFAPALIALDLAAMAFARSTSTILLLPVLYILSLRSLGLRSPAMVRRIALATPLISLIIAAFITQFYGDRLVSGDALNSMQTRLSTILAALEPLRDGEFAGVGVGNNDLAADYIRDVSARYDLRAAVTTGIASLTGQRIFEEGLGAVISIGAALWLLLRNLEHRLVGTNQLIVLIAGGFFVSSSLVSGYRGLYTSWIWIALAGVLHAESRRSPLAASAPASSATSASRSST